MNFKPHKYQEKAIKFTLERACTAHFIEPGLGKTAINYSVFRILKRERMVQRKLVIAPLRVAHSVWPREAQKWDQFQDLRVHVLHGDDKEDLLAAPHDITVINPEGLPWLLGTVRGNKVVHGAIHRLGLHKRWPWQWLNVDESSKFKHQSTERWKTLRPHINKFARRTIGTGSPASNGLMDLFGQIALLDGGASLGGYFTHFRNKYFQPVGYGGFTWVPKEGAEEAIYEAIAELCIVMKEEDYLDLPPFIVNDVTVELPERARRIYTEMEHLFFARLDDDLVTAVNAGAQISKCAQIASGGVYLEGSDRRFKHIHDAKTEAALDIIEERGGKPTFIGYEFEHDWLRMQAHKDWPEDVPNISKVNAAKQREMEDQWNAGKIPVLVGQTASIAHGLNLQDADSHGILYTPTYDLEIYEQFYKRFRRQGRKTRFVLHRLIAEGTVDEAKIASVSRKDRTQRALLNALLEYRRQH